MGTFQGRCSAPNQGTGRERSEDIEGKCGWDSVISALAKVDQIVFKWFDKWFVKWFGVWFGI